MARVLAFAVLFAFGAIALSSLSIAHAWKPNKYFRGEHVHDNWTIPSPPGKSNWCLKNPHLCYPREEGDRKVQGRCDHCMDANGNGDGYVSFWELRRFRKYCIWCN